VSLVNADNDEGGEEAGENDGEWLEYFLRTLRMCPYDEREVEHENLDEWKFERCEQKLPEFD
jgi:hypothetical protein